LVPSALETLRDSGRAWLKLVVDGPHEAEEVEALLRLLHWPRQRALLQAKAARREELSARDPIVRELSNALGLGHSPRLHVQRWNGERGR
jgi:hypothetical protein